MYEMRNDGARGLRRLLIPLGLVFAIFIAGTLGYLLLGGGAWTLSDCAYMTATTVSTVGFREVIPVGDDPVLRAYTIALIFMGTGSILYLLSGITAFLVEGQLNRYLRTRRMERHVDRMRDHYVLCGVGRIGQATAAQLAAGGHRMVVVDHSEDQIRAALDHLGLPLPYVVGEATEEHVLERAGLMHARGLLAALPEDQDNIFLVLSARQMNPRLRIVSKVNDERSRKKLFQVGADTVVSPSAIGGVRMVGEMIRPGVTSFLDDLVRDAGQNLLIDEVPLLEGAPLAGKRLADSGIRQRTNLLVVGLRAAQQGRFVYNPSPDVELAAGMSLIVLGPQDAITTLREMAGAAEPAEGTD